MPDIASLTVSQLNRQVRALIESGLPRVWVEGEISNLSKPASGHIYLTLKDDAAEVSAAWFRQRQRGPAAGFKNGDRVLAFGRVSLYEARGNYQLIIEQLEAAGEGVLKRRYEALKNKLAAEGLFDELQKKALPALPQRIGVITSPSGAALRDILSILGRRFPAIPVVIYPAAVQGDAAPAEMHAALEAAVTRNECDVLIIGRGGGSLEDLWAFNDETLARAIAACPIPIISAVGHEVDFTIADFVADVRAPTPSSAAELVVPDQREWLARIATLASRIARIGERAVEDRAQQLDWLARRLLSHSPRATLQRQRDRLRNQQVQLQSAMRNIILQKHNSLQHSRSALLQASPKLSIQNAFGALNDARLRLSYRLTTLLTKRHHQSAMLARALHTVSPLATLSRGYAIVSNEKGQVLLDTTGVKPGETIEARLANGSLRATVKSRPEN